MSLYETTNDMRELQALADTGELSESDIEDTMEGLNIEFTDQVTACLKVRQSLLAEVDGIDKEIERLVSLKKAPFNSAERLKEYVRSRMLLLDKDKVDAGLFKVTLKKSTQKLGDLDEDKIPKCYFNTIPESKNLDKRLLLSDAKIKDIAGVELTKTERSLTIK